MAFRSGVMDEVSSRLAHLDDFRHRKGRCRQAAAKRGRNLAALNCHFAERERMMDSQDITRDAIKCAACGRVLL